MKILSSTIFSIIFFCSLANAEIKEETYYKIGVFDYVHQTDMLAINKKKVTDNTFNSKYYTCSYSCRACFAPKV